MWKYFIFVVVLSLISVTLIRLILPGDHQFAPRLILIILTSFAIGFYGIRLYDHLFGK